MEGGRGSSVSTAPRTAGGRQGALGRQEGRQGHRQGSLACTEEICGDFSQNSFWGSRREARLPGAEQ